MPGFVLIVCTLGIWKVYTKGHSKYKHGPLTPDGVDRSFLVYELVLGKKKKKEHFEPKNRVVVLA